MATREQEAQGLSAFIEKQAIRVLGEMLRKQLRTEVRWIRDWEDWIASMGSTESRESDAQEEQ